MHSTGLPLSRRHFLSSASGLAMSGFVPAWAQNNDERVRVLWVLLRGAMDGLTAVPPVRDADFERLRPNIHLAQPLPLDTDFALHPSLNFAHELWQAGQLNVIHSTGFQYLGRSHFEGQDIMQSGMMKPYASPTGFVGRALDVSGHSAHGVAISIPMPLLLKGSSDSSTEYPNWMKPASTQLLKTLSQNWSTDPLLRGVALQLQEDQQLAKSMLGGKPSAPFQEARSTHSLARLAGERMKHPDGPRVGLIDMQGGFDTHASQGADTGSHADKLKELDHIFRGFRQGIGEAWRHSLVVTITEFGRNVKENGNEGTDHGVGSCIFVAGGLLSQSRVIADWRGLKADQLIDGRDLPTTIDANAVYSKILERSFNISSTNVQQRVLQHRVHPALTGWLNS
jgi:uncharacterized protein (DUF1501 family)